MQAPTTHPRCNLCAQGVLAGETVRTHRRTGDRFHEACLVEHWASHAVLGANDPTVHYSTTYEVTG